MSEAATKHVTLLLEAVLGDNRVAERLVETHPDTGLVYFSWLGRNYEIDINVTEVH